MGKYDELEIKILKVNKEEIIKKLQSTGAIFIEEKFQEIATYDTYPVSLMYELALNDYKYTKSTYSLNKIINILKYIRPVIDIEEQNIIKKITDCNFLDEYIENNIQNIDINILVNETILKIINECNNKFFKWIRLRKSNDKIELTIKYIYSNKSEYNIDDVKEFEILVNDFDTANKIIEEMGYSQKKLVEKRRTSYTLNNTEVEIDEWPLIDPYIEIEGTNIEEIYKTAQILGYSKEDTKVMNTEDVYLMYGFSINDYKVLGFNQQIKES